MLASMFLINVITEKKNIWRTILPAYWKWNTGSRLKSNLYKSGSMFVHCKYDDLKHKGAKHRSTRHPMAHSWWLQINQRKQVDFFFFFFHISGPHYWKTVKMTCFYMLHTPDFWRVEVLLVATLLAVYALLLHVHMCSDDKSWLCLYLENQILEFI